MKQFIIVLMGCAVLLSSCIEDEGNYQYTAPENPVVGLESDYSVYLGERLFIDPKVSFSDTSLLSYEWVITDMEQMTGYTYEGAPLDIVFTLSPGRYPGRLTITDRSNEMKYFYEFAIYSYTDFNEGIVLLTSNNGQAQLSFIKPDGIIMENLYETIHGESLPPGPMQIVTLQHQNYEGKPLLGYWIICSDKENPGVLIDVNSLMRIKPLRENFFSIPKGELAAGPFFARDDATMAGIINGQFYVGAFQTYYLSPAYGYFGNPIPGNYRLAPILAVAPDGTFVWSYNKEKKSLVCFIPPGGMFFDATSMPGPPPAFDPEHIGLDLITLKSFNSGFYLIGKDDGGEVWELKFSTGAQMVISQYKRPFSRPDLIKEDTKWVLLPGLEIFYFTSGNTIYRYNPLNENIEALSASFAGQITMLKIVNSDVLAVGESGRLLWLDISVGHKGDIIKTIGGFNGEPVDIYER